MYYYSTYISYKQKCHSEIEYPKMTFSLTPLSDLSEDDKDKIIGAFLILITSTVHTRTSSPFYSNSFFFRLDVVGIVTEVTEISELVSKLTNKPVS